MPKFVNHLVRVEDILGSTHDDGELRVNLGDRHTGKGNGASQPVWGLAGFAHRPADPDQDGCAQAYYIVDGNTKRVVATRDNRFTRLQPELHPGESAMFSYSGSFIRCHADGAISLYTTSDNTPDGNQVSLRISPTKGLVYVSPWGHLKHGPDGFHAVHASGPSIDMGPIAGLPSIPGVDLSSYVSIKAATISLAAPVVGLGMDCGVSNLAAITALMNVINAQAAWMALASPYIAAIPAPLTAPQQAQLAAAAAAIVTAVAAYDAVALDIGKIT